jgi:uncharacterized protein (TIGR02266 family)
MGKPARAKAERRKAARHELQVHIDFHTDSQFFNGYSEDMSDGGMFVATYSVLPIGSEVALEFELPAGRKIKSAGRVVWHRDASSGGAPGMGVSLQAPSDEDREAILEFTRERPPLFYDPT